MIWVLSPDNKMSEYDAVQFRVWVSGVALPPEARKHPENIFITNSGIVMYADVVPGTTLRRVWSTNRYANELIGGADDRRPSTGGGFQITSATPAVYAGADGQRLFWFEDHFSTLSRGPDVSREGSFLSWTTDLTGNGPRPVTSFRFESCKCETGACSESCPETLVWAPEAGISDFFFLTRWVPGQIGSTYVDTSLYTFASGVWTARKLDHAVDNFLDAADHGNLYLESPNDTSGDDDPADAPGHVTLMNVGGKAVTIFDEHVRFRDGDYVVGIATTRAAISPDRAHVAYSLAGAPPPEQEIQPRVAGKGNSQEIRRLNAVLAELPRLEVIAVSDPAKITHSLPNTDLLGWLDAGHLLALHHGELQVVDVSTGAIKPTGIKADNVQFAFLR